MTFEERSLLILYGSQTGTAQEVAEQIWRDGKRRNWHGPVKAMDEIEPVELLRQKVCIFVCSTTGQGEEPDNMKMFWKFLLQRSLPPTSLTQLKYAVLGLGDSSYAKFNFVAKRLNKRLAQLGGDSILAVGLGDDQHELGPDAVVGPWTKTLWDALDKIHPLDGKSEFNPFEMRPLRYKIKITKKEDAAPISEKPSLEKSTILKATLEENKRTTSPSHYQDVRLLKISVPGIQYKPGDVLMVQPKNLKENVQRLLEIFNLCGQDVIELHQTDDKFPIALPPSWMCPNPCTVADCVQNLLDLQAIPQRYCLQLMAHFTTSELEKERLLEFCTPEGQQDLYSYAHRPKRGTLEVLEDFPHALAALPVEYLFDIFKVIRPRAFSIASALEMHPNTAELLVAVVNYRTMLKTARLGLCSNWMARLEPSSELSVWVKTGSFKFPSTVETPIICVGPGTGCAPFRSLIQQRAALNPDNKGKIVLFFGCRNKEGDFHCAEEWKKYDASGIIKLCCAFSQDQSHKIYVQHKMLEESSHIWDLLSKGGAHFFVAGNSKNMPKSVRDAVVEIGQKEGGLSLEEAEAFVSNLEKSGRYQTETWA
ncbi:NADPH-dependent diflavin oxidoreductase 1 [Neocloeon triangulifer]|uniref:NADPH-dependent diflavin oxidoreductase 1 n=1 Tax=Neocloeon triangulifer TaxID=2078957 RepID=UPI00286FAF06|nr:NADPH-dependent diflavin oxidoreductase 1 [Neocloeon triangulifer]XP_059486667.1 NADPH-dependent diflavin oxidoreductase 1 [Neocloeon triangulifer]